MTERIPELNSRVWVVALRIIFYYEIQEVLYIIFMDEFTECSFGHFAMIAFDVACPCSEKLLEVECRVLDVLKSGKGFTEVECKNVETRKTGIRVRITKVIDVPFCFGFLLHDIVPGVDFVFGVVFKKVEWSAGKVKYVSILFGKKFYDVLTEFRLGTFMRFIDDKHVVLCLEYCRVLIEFSSCELRSTQVLHRCKVHIMLVRIFLGDFFQ